MAALFDSGRVHDAGAVDEDAAGQRAGVGDLAVDGAGVDGDAAGHRAGIGQRAANRRVVSRDAGLGDVAGAALPTVIFIMPVSTTHGTVALFSPVAQPAVFRLKVRTTSSDCCS